MTRVDALREQARDLAFRLMDAQITGAAVPQGTLVDAAALLPELVDLLFGPGSDDDQLVDGLARELRERLAASRRHGSGGWEDPTTCPVTLLYDMLRNQLARPDLNLSEVVMLAGMLWARVRMVAADGEVLRQHVQRVRPGSTLPALPPPVPSPRELDARLGEALGLCVWRAFPTQNGTVRKLLPVELAEDEGEPVSHPAVPLAAQWNHAPPYSENREACGEAEDVVLAGELADAYVSRLALEAQAESHRPAWQAVTGASAAARVRAMLAVLASREPSGP